jgi:hypothetical protein
MPAREVTYEAGDARLTRHVRLADGRQYTHTCALEVLAEVAWYVQERGEAGVSAGGLWRALPQVPFTQAHVALAFLQDRGCVVRGRQRLSYPASDTVYEDALAAYYHLADHGT